MVKNYFKKLNCSSVYEIVISIDWSISINETCFKIPFLGFRYFVFCFIITSIPALAGIPIMFYIKFQFLLFLISTISAASLDAPLIVHYGMCTVALPFSLTTTLTVPENFIWPQATVQTLTAACSQFPGGSAGDQSGGMCTMIAPVHLPTGIPSGFVWPPSSLTGCFPIITTAISTETSISTFSLTSTATTTSTLTSMSVSTTTATSTATATSTSMATLTSVSTVTQTQTNLSTTTSMATTTTFSYQLATTTDTLTTTNTQTVTKTATSTSIVTVTNASTTMSSSTATCTSLSLSICTVMAAATSSAKTRTRTRTRMSTSITISTSTLTSMQIQL